MISIGVHTYGGVVNSATVLGEFGNRLEPYIQALSKSPTESIENEGGVEALSFQPIDTTIDSTKASSPFKGRPHFLIGTTLGISVRTTLNDCLTKQT